MLGAWVRQAQRWCRRTGHSQPGPCRLGSAPGQQQGSVCTEPEACRPQDQWPTQQRLLRKAPQWRAFIIAFVSTGAALSTGRVLTSQEHIKCWWKLKAKLFSNQIVIIPKGMTHWAHLHQYLLPSYIIMGYLIIQNTLY